VKLVTYSAPRAGDYDFAVKLTREKLQAQLYDPGPVAAADGAAMIALDPSIVDRLNDTDRPAGFRVLVSTDPVTTTKIGNGGNHVGTTVYVNGKSAIDWIGVPDFNDHEPATVRKYLTDAYKNADIPDVAWRYHLLGEFAPSRIEAQKGTRAELQKLADGLKKYYSDRSEWFDEAPFTSDLDLLFRLGGQDQ
jgi:hypothetical protein